MEGEGNAVQAAIANARARIVNRETITALKSPVVNLETHDYPELLDALSMVKPDTNDAELRSLVMTNLDALLREAGRVEARSHSAHDARQRSLIEIRGSISSCAAVPARMLDPP